MKKTTATLMATAALIAVAGCSKKPPAQLPPAPPSDVSQPAPPSSSTGDVGNTVVPGSRADLLAQAGTDTVLFVTDSSDVDAEAQAILTRQAAWLRKYPQVRVTVEGHCDERGTREYNLALGDRRANSAKNFLVNAGVPASRISVISYGKERPAAQGSDESAWAQNRRAVTVVPE
ncbi:peptidoglycan-associated lipoprotein Pal [uncultured Sphingomonas sp.]|uniref:peptidoglycan-associated lipoprotein Pal n=1 Tax=uncultured Sphingomonas sp. TaxID=158754 RepID=UPI0025F28125|nr:peptidoglycan-associated lipoprotein Pal [uncultured Sphingomonas sp.]